MSHFNVKFEDQLFVSVKLNLLPKSFYSSKSDQRKYSYLLHRKIFTNIRAFLMVHVKPKRNPNSKLHTHLI